MNLRLLVEDIVTLRGCHEHQESINQITSPRRDVVTSYHSQRGMCTLFKAGTGFMLIVWQHHPRPIARIAPVPSSDTWPQYMVAQGGYYGTIYPRVVATSSAQGTGGPSNQDIAPQSPQSPSSISESSNLETDPRTSIVADRAIQ